MSHEGSPASSDPFVYTVPMTVGSYTIAAPCTGEYATATVDVVADGGLSVEVIPAEVDLAKGGTANFTAWVNGGEGETVTWSCSGGTIDPATGLKFHTGYSAEPIVAWVCFGYRRLM